MFTFLICSAIFIKFVGINVYVKVKFKIFSEYFFTNS